MPKILFSIFLIVFSSVVSANTEFTVMHGAGGVSDITTRFLSNQLGNQKYSVVNRPGAAGKIAIRHLISERTIMLATMVQVFVTNPINHKDLFYDPKKDLSILATIAVMPSALICNKNTGISNFQEFKNTKKILTFGVGGYGSSEHVSTEVLISKLDANHKVIPYAQGGNSAIKDLLGGHIDCMFGNYPTVKPHVENDRLNLIMTSHDVGQNVLVWTREFNQPFPFQSYLSVITTAKMDVETQNKIKEDFQKAFAQESYKTELSALGLFSASSTDKADIDRALKACNEVNQFILSNNIRTSNQN